ncbi:MAG: type I restriction enzyme HsdR N-terminal domain-containing protein [Bacteroidia bacterium]|nr:type I restriction enzyme HsdR N-terminal domain-containing protein [Bacteroidia bacterium]
MRKFFWDPIRRKAVVSTPEEEVRQRFIAFLLERGYPSSAIQVEYRVENLGRFDVAVNAPDGTLWLLAECKANTSSPFAQWSIAWTQLRRYSQALPSLHYFVIVIGSQIWCWNAQTGALEPTFPSYPR